MKRLLWIAPLGLLASSVTIAQSGYQIGENGAAADSGPVRLARVAYVTGPVAWRPADAEQWSTVTNNLPFRQGAQIWAKSGGRCELQFDDGATMRIGGGALVTLQNMYSDDRGEFTELKLNNGLATCHLRSKLSQYQIDTPLSDVRSVGPAEFRVGVGKTVEIACDGGQATVEGQQGQTVCHARERLEILNATDAYRLTTVPSADDWDRFNSNRDRIYSHRNVHLPQNLDIVAGNLDDYGVWHNDPSYGYVWAPRVHEVGWRPYHHGRWAWVSPWGWTWVGEEDWGWAPYRYGAWVHRPYGWAWRPGPAIQYWSPAVVDFVDYNDTVAWVPLAPAEVVYPSAINIGFRSGNWWLNFSIGQAGCYYPSGPRFCAARPWDNRFVNRQVNVYNITNIRNIYNASAFSGNQAFVRNSRFIPTNSVRAAGATWASRSAFAGSGRFQPLAADPRGTMFRNGRSYSRAPSGAQISGPLAVQPGRTSFMPTRAIARNAAPPQSLLQRSVVRSRMSSALASHAMPIGRASAASTRRASVLRQPTVQKSATMRSRFTMKNNARLRPQTAPPVRRAGALNHSVRSNAGRSKVSVARRPQSVAAHRTPATVRSRQTKTIIRQNRAPRQPTRTVRQNPRVQNRILQQRPRTPRTAVQSHARSVRPVTRTRMDPPAQWHNRERSTPVRGGNPRQVRPPTNGRGRSGPGGRKGHGG